MKIRALFAIGISIVILLSGCGKVSSESAPDFTLPDKDGNMVHLAEELQDNEQVVLVFYFGVSCPPCTRQLGDIQKDYAKYEQLGAKVLAIAVQSPLSAQFSADVTGAQYPILADSDHVVAEAYGVYDTGLSTPSVFVINQEGEIVWKNIAVIEGTGCGDERIPSETILENLIG
jgi:peroxiredoxin Q/BCP